MSISENDILQWVEQCQKGHRASQEKLYKHFYPLFMPICMSYVANNDDAVDIYNRAFLKVFNSLEQFKGQGAFGAWVRRIVVNASIDFVRQSQKLNFNCPLEEAQEVRLNETVLSELTANEILGLFRFLPPTQRLVLNLYIVEGKSHKEIGEDLGISSGTSKWHLNQGRKVLQEKLLEFGIVSNMK
ncbi:MAG: RNA polymerase sigma factor [Flavobacteriales bacterium]|nr:RNA polymerase sigma factor [Flavobacteriales bacterium]